MESLFYQKNVVITGGSSGIGLALAKAFAEKEARLFLLARNLDRLERAKMTLEELYPTVVVSIHSVDVTDKAGLQIVMEEIGDQQGGIHTLVNNAGRMGVKKIEDSAVEDMRQLMDINYWGTVHATQYALPYLKKSPAARVAFVSSVAGYLGAFGYSEYAPTKFAMTGFAECLRMEVEEYDIKTSIIFPPDTDTPMWEWEQANNQPESRALSKNAKVVSPDLVAKKLLAGIEDGKFEIFCNAESKWIRRLKYLFPKLYFNIMDGIVRKDRNQRLQ